MRDDAITHDGEQENETNVWERARAKSPVYSAVALIPLFAVVRSFAVATAFRCYYYAPRFLLLADIVVLFFPFPHPPAWLATGLYFCVDLLFQTYISIRLLFVLYRNAPVYIFLSAILLHIYGTFPQLYQKKKNFE